MAHRLDRDDLIGPGGLLLIIAFDCRTASFRDVRRFYISPREVLVPVLPVPFSRLLLVGGADALHAATVRGVLTYLSKSPDVAHFKHDGETKDNPDAGDGKQSPELISQADQSNYCLFDLLLSVFFLQ